MFSKNEYVFHESGGVCRVSDVKFAPLEGMPADREYYILCPIHDPNSTIFVPIDSDRVFMRRLIDREEAERLFATCGDIEILEEATPKLLRAAYVDTLCTYRPLEWIRVIKTLGARTEQLAARSQRVSETERSYAETAKRYLYAELSIVLNISEREAELRLYESMHAVKI